MSQPSQRTITIRYTPATRSVVYDRRESILCASDVHNLIRTLNRTRISTLAPTKPKGGEIYVYRSRIIGKSWRNDGYEGSWKSNGTHYYPRFGSLEYCKQNAVFKVVRHYSANESANNPRALFRRVAFIELQRQGKENPLTIVHYVGDESIGSVRRPHGNTKHGRQVGRSRSRRWRTVNPDLIESTTDCEVVQPIVQPMDIGADVSSAAVSTAAGTPIVNSSSSIPALARAASATALNEDLREASALGDIDRVAELLSAGADVLSANRVNGWTALHWAAKRGHAQVAGLLLGRGADPEARNTSGQMPADLSGCDKMIRMLGTGTSSHHKVVVPRGSAVIAAAAAAANSDTSDPGAAADAEDRTTAGSCGDGGGGFVPNYLRNPEFPYASGQNHRRRRLSGGGAARRPRGDTAAASTSQLLLQERAQHCAPVLLQVRVANSADPDFIEVELTYPSFEDLMELVCQELSLDPASVERIRKLPNVRLRNDGDVGRLVQGQQLEIVLRDF